MNTVEERNATAAALLTPAHLAVSAPLRLGRCPGLLPKQYSLPSRIARRAGPLSSAAAESHTDSEVTNSTEGAPASPHNVQGVRDEDYDAADARREKSGADT